MTVRAVAFTLTVLFAVAVSTLGGQTPSIPAQARLKAFEPQLAPIVAQMRLDEKACTQGCYGWGGWRNGGRNRLANLLECAPESRLSDPRGEFFERSLPR